MDFPDIPDYVAGYFDFIIDFATKPAKACEPYKGLNKVDKTLLSFAAIGIAFTWLTILITKKLAASNNDQSGIFKYVENINIETIPLVVIPSILLLSLFIHAMVKLVFILHRKEYHSIVKGNINFKNTFNGTLGFFAFAPFAFVVVFLGCLIILYQFDQKHLHWAVLLIVLLPLIFLEIAFLFWYLPISISAVQPENISKNFKRAILSIYYLVMVVLAITLMLRDFLN